MLKPLSYLPYFIDLNGKALPVWNSLNLITGLGKWAFGGGSFSRDVLQATWKPVWNGMKIDAGMFVFDNPFQAFSRWTWELPQSLIGNAWSSARNVAGYADQIKYYRGATFIIHDNSSKYDGVTLGNYINMNIRDPYDKTKYEPSWNDNKFTPIADNMMMHEYGHFLQSQRIGFFYLSAVGIPSLINRLGWIGGDKDRFYTEKWANNLAYHFFVGKEHGGNGWDFGKYPIDNQGGKEPWVR
ncbi:hypothetical protein M2450_000315 [Dysgonomonas sp. PF1-23]|nr:hypothetical protein [Dysgonomonas sp. PF1-23]